MKAKCANDGHPLKGLQIYRSEIGSLPRKVARAQEELQKLNNHIENMLEAFDGDDYKNLVSSTKKSFDSLFKTQTALQDIESALRNFD